MNNMLPKGELSDIRLPPAESGITKFSTTKGLLYHDACGLLSVAKLHSRDQNTKPLETSNVPKTPETVAADRPTPTFMLGSIYRCPVAQRKCSMLRVRGRK